MKHFTARIGRFCIAGWPHLFAVALSSCTEDPRVRCGDGTHIEGDVCIRDESDATVSDSEIAVDSGADAADASLDTSAETDGSTADAEVLVDTLES
ncbi:MAG: hypothetical protein ACXWUG_31520, partial [Polyangiales bacterium]